MVVQWQIYYSNVISIFILLTQREEKNISAVS